MSDHSDDDIIRRLRSALDEVAARTTQEDVAMVPNRFPSGAPRRWLAVAAVSVVLVGAAVFALSRRSDEPVAEPASSSTASSTTISPSTSLGTTTTPGSSPDSVVAPTTPGTDEATTTTTMTSTTTTTPPGTMAWFALEAPGFTAGDLVHDEAMPLDQQRVCESWTVPQTDAPGYLLVSIATGLTAGIEGDYTSEQLDVADGVAYFLRPNRDGAPLDYGYELRWFRSDGTAWLFQSQGITRDRLVSLALSAVPGSGVPVVIADPSVSVLRVGTPSGADTAQTYSGDGGTVRLAVENDSCGLDPLISAANIIDVTVAGIPGHAALLDNNQVEVAWDAGGGWWGHLTVSSELSRAADGIIAEVVAAPSPG